MEKGLLLRWESNRHMPSMQKVPLSVPHYQWLFSSRGRCPQARLLATGTTVLFALLGRDGGCAGLMPSMSVVKGERERGIRS